MGVWFMLDLRVLKRCHSWQIVLCVLYLLICCGSFRSSSPLWTSSSTPKLCCQPSAIWTMPCLRSSTLPKREMPKNRWRGQDRAGPVSPDRLITEMPLTQEMFTGSVSGSLQCLKEPKMSTSSALSYLPCWAVSTWRCVMTTAALLTSLSKVQIRIWAQTRHTFAYMQDKSHWTLCRNWCVCIGAGEGDRGVRQTTRHCGHRCRPQNRSQKGLPQIWWFHCPSFSVNGVHRTNLSLVFILQAVSIVGEEVFNFKLSLFPGSTEGEGYGDMSKVDGKVTMRLGCIRIVYLHKFLVSLLVRSFTYKHIQIYAWVHTHTVTWQVPPGGATQQL